MAFQFRFKIEEQPDAKSFIFTDITGDYSTENTTGWGASSGFEKSAVASASIVISKYYDDTTIENHTITAAVALWAEGVEFFKTSAGGDTYEDEAYKITVTILGTGGETFSTTIDYGFFELIKSYVMVQSLTYTPALPRRTKDLILEKIRLLDNLVYATETDQIQYFKDNLERLKQLE